MPKMTLTAIPNLPAVQPKDDIASMTLAAMRNNGIDLQDDDVLVFAQKIVSKTEDRYAYLNEVEPSEEAVTLAVQVEKDPRLVELILSESSAVLRHRPGVLIVQHRQGYVLANAGIDQSNIDSDPENPRVLLLPKDCDASANALKAAIFQQSGKHVYVIINDSVGRAWRNGSMGMTLGAAGFQPLESLVGSKDLFGRIMTVTEVAVADELSAAASFVMGQSNEGTPVVHIHGAKLTRKDTNASELIRAVEKDLFR